MDVLSREEWKEHTACARSGDSDAQWLVGYYYQYGAKDNTGKWLVKPDALRARQWYERAAEQGCANAQNALATLLTDADAFPVDYAAAIHWYKKAINQGDASAAYNLGLTYRDLGKPALAYRWYAKAAAMGDKDAHLQIGLCNLFGFGVKQNFQEARECFTKVIESTPWKEASQSAIENAHYWVAIMGLTGLSKGRSLASTRKSLEIANQDDEHEQANDLLNVIGRARRINEARKKRGKMR